MQRAMCSEDCVSLSHSHMCELIPFQRAKNRQMCACYVDFYFVVAGIVNELYKTRAKDVFFMNPVNDCH